MASDWVDAVLDGAVAQVTGILSLEVSLHDSEPDLTNPAATELGIVSRVFIDSVDWSAPETDGIYRRQLSTIELHFGTASGSGSASWLVLWDVTEGGDSAIPVGKIKLTTEETIQEGQPVIIPAGNLVIRAAGQPE